MVSCTSSKNLKILFYDELFISMNFEISMAVMLSILLVMIFKETKLFCEILNQ